MHIEDYLGKYPVKTTKTIGKQTFVDLEEHPIRLSFVVYGQYTHISSAFSRADIATVSNEMMVYFADIYKDTVTRLKEHGYAPGKQPIKNLESPYFEVRVSYIGYTESLQQEELQDSYQKVVEAIRKQYPSMTFDHDPKYLWGESLIITPFEHYQLVLVCPDEQQFKYQIKADENSGFDKLPELHEKMLSAAENFGHGVNFYFNGLQALFFMDVHNSYLKQDKLQANSLLATINH